LLVFIETTMTNKADLFIGLTLALDGIYFLL